MGINDDGRRMAIRAAMEAAGHIEDDILDAIASLGLKEGGRVGYIHGGITHADGRRGFFKGAEADARAGRASMSPGTSHSGGMRSGFGGTGNTGTGTTTTTPITKTIKTKTINEPIGILANIKNMFRRGNPEDVDLGEGWAEKAKDEIIANKNLIATQTTDKPGFDPNDSSTWEFRSGGRIGLDNGGIMHAKRGFVDGPGGYAGLEEIEDMREFRIANQGIEDVADYKGYYERLKNPQNYDEQGFEIKEEVDFGGVKEAVGNIAEENELVASRQSDFFMLREEAIMKNDFDKIKEIEFDFFKEFGIKMPVAQNISDEAPVQMAADGGMMSVLPKGREMDYRGGGVIPMGSKERADDVPARLSKNEFVMTADAVRAAGGGSVNKGAKRMYNLMHKLEARV